MGSAIRPLIGTPTVLAVAESDAYLKWVAWLLDGVGWDVTITVVASDIAPSERQRVAAVARTRFENAVLDDTLRSLRRRVRGDAPDVLLLACTGPTIAVITSVLPRAHRPAVVVSGLPGVGLPVRERAIRARSGTDVFIAHSQREREEWGAAFATTEPAGAEATVVALATLPFLRGIESGGRGDSEPVGTKIVFAPQPSVPAEREQRRHLLARLAVLGPPAPVVKMRSRGAEAVTHREPHPYDDLWEELVAAGTVSPHDVEFVDGSLVDSLADASCLVTVSSTAALEAIGLGCPVVIIDDFGVDDELLNGVFAGSGITGSLDRSTIAAAPSPDPAWLERNYFHDRDADDWERVILERRAAAGAPGRRRGRRVSVRTLTSRTVLAKAWRMLGARPRQS